MLREEEERIDEEIHDWYGANAKIAEEAKQTGVASTRRLGIQQADLVNMN
jgi:hypothetical protein